VAEIAALADGAGGRTENGIRMRRRPNTAADESEERDEALWAAVHKLPARQRSAILLRYVADLHHRDIATTIGCSEEAARRSLHEGLNKLRKVIA
jgi:RNA polymerase sigma factor (sigma-70 family)